MKKIVTALILLFFPSWLANRIIRLWGVCVKGHIGFSLVICDHYELDAGSFIQSGCYINVPSIRMKTESTIKKFTMIKGGFSVAIQEQSVIKPFCKISNSKALQYKEIKFELGKMSIVGLASLIDMTSNVRIGDYSVFAGLGTQIWTHSYYHSKEVPKRFRIDGDVFIGNNVYIGSRCIITAGVTISDNISLGAGSVVSKDLIKSGLYVNQPLRFLEFDPDEKIQAYEQVKDAPVDIVFHK